MTRYIGQDDFSHGTPGRLGILLVNLGTPTAPTTSAVRRYLREFLWDPRVIEVPRPLWALVLFGFIQWFRAPRSAAAYRQIWTEQGSPLMVGSLAIRDALRDELGRRIPGLHSVELAMRYGEPSIATVLAGMRAENVRRLLVLPLYPQYSATTTASAIDAVTQVMQRTRWIPELRTINHYHDHTALVMALSETIEARRAERGGLGHLLFSFHGLPQRYLDAGDPYHCQCQKTARMVAERLHIAPDKWSVAFQSRVGREPWLAPYTDQVLQQLGAAGADVTVICPGFSVDCLETLEEIALRGRDTFLAAGGGGFDYVPCLNEHADHVRMLAELVMEHTAGWPELRLDHSENRLAETLHRSREAALAKGADR
jgi:protoporphyrin/coproporphyrin ferrochelatase